MNILLIGNGFDLEHNLPTKYTDFLEFVKKYQNMYLDKSIVSKKISITQDEYLNYIFNDCQHKEIVNALHAFTSENIWIEYFNNILSSYLVNKQTWIDFENEISNVIQALDKLIKYYESLQTEGIRNTSSEMYYKEKLLKIIDINSLKYDSFSPDTFALKADIATLKSYISILLNDLNKLIGALEIYIWSYIGKYNLKYYSPSIDKIHPNKVLSFNYSDTYRLLYAYNRTNIEYSFVHGFATNNVHFFANKENASKIELKEYIQKSADNNNMVLGIDEYLTDAAKNKETDFIAFKKYYQRIYKKNGNEYKKWLQQIDKDINDGRKEKNSLFIFGHSLDETDGDILRELISHKHIKTVIYYKDKKHLGQLIANLVKILERDNVIEKVYGSSPSIIFEQQKPRELIEGSPFEITSDTMKLYNVYNYNYVDANNLITKIKSKIKNKDLDYFHSQKAVITLFDALQRNGLGQKYKDQLLHIAYALIQNNGQKPIQHNPEAWDYADYDGYNDCDSLTYNFIKLLNIYNKKNFTEGAFIQTIDTQLMEYRKLISENLEIDKDHYISIINDIFLMFYNDRDTKELWDMLLKISRGPAEKIAIDTLKELITSTNDDFNIIRYTHLLYEIEMNRYFEMKEKEYEEINDQT